MLYIDTKLCDHLIYFSLEHAGLVSGGMLRGSRADDMVYQCAHGRVPSHAIHCRCNTQTAREHHFHLNTPTCLLEQASENLVRVWCISRAAEQISQTLYSDAALHGKQSSA